MPSGVLHTPWQWHGLSRCHLQTGAFTRRSPSALAATSLSAMGDSYSATGIAR